MRVDPETLKYRNVTISGLPGAGSTTLGRRLGNVLGWEYFSGGDFLRAYAIEKGWFDPKSKLHHDQSIMPDDADRMVDFGMREKLEKTSGKILDSWLSGFMAQGVVGTLKILVYCSDDAIRVDRIVNRDSVTIEEAKQHIFEREAKNRQKWTRMYKDEWETWVVRRGLADPEDPIDFWDPRLYDLVIDTYANSRQETLKKALAYLGYTKQKTT